MTTLWELLTPKSRQHARPAGHPRVEPQPAPRPRAAPMAQRYEAITRQMLDAYGVRVRKWRTSMSGCAWQVTYADGRVARLVEAPKPRGPMSAAVFLHEIGHHAIGLGAYRPRCLEEYHAWAFALRTMDELGLNITDRVRQRMADSLRYAVDKARRRGLRAVPAELVPYLDHPATTNHTTPTEPSP